ncbi:hypothetical protein BKA67DRAFT_540944 [Truncatella angustata]|uniref:Uncharacterized protein n=1 Tax=Truncatella angustata TaxID=152316 RepID=A0A9P8UCL5_9PEZI|nr:uncharacterized protein BKA67DRAFT_540944 [Truncatella angustata]KAH6645952.1 hypothetical protein BKA67DRAFT_540944 [Truncatella angustata]KAH8205331.1 hypothetical protein TruAng_000578 [Truncatella angustata]
MPQVLRRRDQKPGAGLEAVLAAQSRSQKPVPIPGPPETAEEVKETCDSFTLESFTTEDAWELGHLLYARLLPFASEKPTLISIALANSGQVLFQTAVGSGTVPDNEIWVKRKRNSVLRWGSSTWLLHCKYNADEELFRAKFGMSQEQAGNYAIHGGGVPIKVKGVEGIVAIVVVSGLKQHEDHGVIVDVIRNNWE